MELPSEVYGIPIDYSGIRILKGNLDPDDTLNIITHNHAAESFERAADADRYFRPAVTFTREEIFTPEPGSFAERWKKMCDRLKESRRKYKT